MALTEELVRDTYTKLKNKAAGYIKRGNIQKGLLFTHLAAYTNYSFWLSYHDDEVESLLKNAGGSIKKREYNKSNVIAGHCVLLDSMARYRGGLTVQYVNAIIAAGWNFLYITSQEINAPHHVELYNYLSSLPGVEIKEVPKKLQGTKRLQFIYNAIIDYGAERVYLHCTSSDSLFPVVGCALPSAIQKFYIDAADHGFRMGMGACDYVFEFRNLGCSIAVQYRHYPADNIFVLPYYPIMDQLEFKGLPAQSENKVIILSGGIFWKIIDKEDTFFKLCQKIIQQNPNAIILYPGGGDSSIVESKIKEYNISERFILLGWRDDISELFRHSDIFLNTYPHGGGTMSQYAAHLKKPIISYRPKGECPNPVENFVCQDHFTEVSSVGEMAFLDEAHRLINDPAYRKEKAERTYSCVLGIERFHQYFKKMSVEHQNLIPFVSDENVSMPYERLEKKLKYHNELGEYQMRLVAMAGLNSITLRGEFLKPFVRKIFPKLKRVFFTRGLHFNRV